MQQAFRSYMTGDGKIWVLDQTTRVLMDYQAGVGAAVNDPARYRIDGMSDDDHAELLAAAEAKRPALAAQNAAILRTRGIAAALLIGMFTLFGFAPHADANGVLLCRPDRGQAFAGGSTVNLPGASKSYTADSSACAYISSTDQAAFKGQGWYEPGKTRSIIFNVGVATGTTDFVIGTLPANAYISSVTATNSTANAVTGGIAVGNAANGTQYVTALTCAANCLSGTTSITSTAYSASPQLIHAAAVTSWNSSNVTLTVTYGYF